MSSPYYDQGKRDAENGEFNQLFYHTYHDYRRGYDEVQKGAPKKRVSALLALALILGLGVGLGWFLRDRGVLGQAATATPLVVTATPPTPSPTFPFIIATPAPPTPTIAPNGLRPGGTAIVATDGGGLLVRPEPTRDNEPLASLPNGTAVTIVDGPREGDNFVWWKIETPQGAGWAVADFLKPAP